MNWARRHIGGLHWRLTVYYFLVTLVVALTMEAAVVLRPFVVESQQTSQRVAFGPMLESQAP